MREIKFRAWDKKQKKMFDVFELNFNRYGYSVRVKGYIGTIIQPVLLQFTGLTDKNGKEIYEGDIVKNDVFILKNYGVGVSGLLYGKSVQINKFEFEK